MLQSEEIVANGKDKDNPEPDHGDSGGPPATIVEIVAISVFLIALALLLLTGLIQLWPGPTPAGGTQPTVTEVTLLFWTIPVSDEVRLLLLVVFTGALGGLLHAMRSVTWYIGQRMLKRNWLVTYITQPFVGATLAFIFYLVIRGGFFSPQASFQQTSPFGFAAMAGLIGLFSPQAVLKLKEVAEVILTRPPAGKDTAPQEFGVAERVIRPTQPQLPPPASNAVAPASNTVPPGAGASHTGSGAP